MTRRWLKLANSLDTLIGGATKDLPMYHVWPQGQGLDTDHITLLFLVFWPQIAGTFHVLCDNERVQQESSDSSQQRLCDQQPGFTGRGRQHRLLVVPGGRRHHADEPEHRREDLPALGPLEGLLPHWSVTALNILEFNESIRASVWQQH